MNDSNIIAAAFAAQLRSDRRFALAALALLAVAAVLLCFESAGPGAGLVCKAAALASIACGMYAAWQLGGTLGHTRDMRLMLLLGASTPGLNLLPLGWVIAASSWRLRSLPLPARTDLDYIRAIAPVLLGDAAPRFKEALTLLLARDERFRSSGLAEKYPFDLYGLSLEQMQGNDDDTIATLFFEEFAVAEGYTRSIDWSGEESKGDLEKLIRGRLGQLRRPDLDWSFLQRWEDTLEWGSMIRGEYIADKFAQIDRALRQQGLALAFLQVGTDSYQPFLVTRAQFRWLCRLRPDSGQHPHIANPQDWAAADPQP